MAENFILSLFVNNRCKVTLVATALQCEKTPKECQNGKVLEVTPITDVLV